jgi:hypothetical protein
MQQCVKIKVKVRAAAYVTLKKSLQLFMALEKHQATSL